jgi:glycosyltransferase involved in cell wall biosynthesis
MKILVIPFAYPSIKNPYAGIFFKNQVQLLRKNSFSVDVLYVHVKSLRKISWPLLEIKKTNLDGGCEIHITTFNFLPGSSFFQGLQSILLGVLGYIFLLKKYDVIHSHGIIFSGVLGSAISFFSGSPHVVSEHRKSDPDKIPLAELIYSRWVIKKANLITCPSNYFLDFFKKCYPSKLPNENFMVLPNVIDEVFFAPITSSEYITKSSAINIVFVGNLIPLKGILNLVEVWPMILKKAPQSFLHIVGSGSQLNNILSFIDENKLKSIKYHGVLDHQQIKTLLDNSDIFCLPSTSETFCCAALESLTRGIPVLLGPCGGAEDFVSKNNGRFMKDISNEELVKNVISMIDNLHLFNKMAISNEIQSNYSLINMFEIYKSMYKKLIYKRLNPP